MRITTVMLFCLVSGCTTVTYPVVGKFHDFNEVLIGHINQGWLAGGTYVEVRGNSSGVVCSGTSRVFPADDQSVSGQCKGRTGDTVLNCTDGRAIGGAWEASSCTSAFGTGRDSNGVALSFVFGMTDEEAIAYIDSAFREVAHLPSLPAYRPEETRRQEGFATGTGFFVSNEGHLITNFHVIDGASSISIMWRSSEYPALVIASDPANDVALLKIAATTPSLTLSSASSIQRGDEVLALGYPLIALQGQSLKATFGRVNSLSGIQDDVRFLQIDAAIQPGNSGGPLLDDKGRVIAVVTATLNQLVALRESGTLAQSVNYAVKADYIIPLLGARLGGNAEPLVKLEFPAVVKASEHAVVLVIAR